MTTIAYDGRMLAADSLATCAGLKHSVSKIHQGTLTSGEKFLLGVSGDRAQGFRLAEIVKAFTLIEIRRAKWISESDRDSFDPAGLLVIRTRRKREAFTHIGGCFVPLSRPYDAIGSGRDYALAAMRLGQGARAAVAVAKEFDAGTGGRIVGYEV